MPWPTPTYDECQQGGDIVTVFPDGPRLGKPACRYRDAAGAYRYAALGTPWTELPLSARWKLTWEEVQARAGGITRAADAVIHDAAAAVTGTARNTAGAVLGGAAQGAGVDPTKPPVPALFQSLFGVPLWAVAAVVVVLFLVLARSGQGGAAVKLIRG